MTTLTVAEALTYLSSRNVTSNEEMVRRWIRKGKIKAQLISRKLGYAIDQSSLVAFADAYVVAGKSKSVSDPIYASARLQRSISQLEQLPTKESQRWATWYMDQMHEQKQSFKQFKRLVRSLVDDGTWKFICDQWNQELTAKRNERKASEES